MSKYRYADAVRRILEHYEETQGASIDAAAGLVISALRNRGAVFCAEIGHGTQGDFLNRAGGLAAVQSFSFSFSVSDTVPECLAGRPAAEAVDREIEAIRLAVRTSSMRAGDVLLVGSVSGRNVRPIGMSEAARACGIKVVAFTSLVYTEQVESLHPSGKKLRDVADVVIDNGAPLGDAACSIPGVDIDVLPVSGVSMDIGGWLIWERVIEAMAADGDAPTVYMSVNRPGGMDYYQTARARYQERGY